MMKRRRPGQWKALRLLLPESTQNFLLCNSGTGMISVTQNTRELLPDPRVRLQIHPGGTVSFITFTPKWLDVYCEWGKDLHFSLIWDEGSKSSWKRFKDRNG